jgi:hypothetical protein
MIYYKGNGKFFTDPPMKEEIKYEAFANCVFNLQAWGHISSDQLNIVLKEGFKRTFRCADEPLMLFMQKRMDAAEENDVRMIFGILEVRGWRFFGRV